jgi:5'-nucleotidase
VGISPPQSNQILQVSEGFTYAWNPAGATCNKVDAASIKVNGVTIDLTRKYRVTVSSYLAEGGDRLFEFTRGTERVDGAKDVDALAAYFAKHHSISPSRLDRIKTSPQPSPD